MTDAASSQRRLAELLLSTEAQGDSDPLRTAHAFDGACRRLTAQLARVFGDAGARAVLLRALMITKAEFPLLAAEPAPGGGECLKAPATSLVGQGPAVIAEALTSLLANIIGVLLDLLGRNLVYRFLSSAWPEMDLP